jgi:gluconolactonase
MGKPEQNGSGEVVHFVSHSREFAAVLGAEPAFATLIDTDAHEGPVYVAARQSLYFTTTPVNSEAPIAGSKSVQVRRLALDTAQFPFTVRTDEALPIAARVANGMTLDRHGDLLICEQGTRALPARISRLPLSGGALETLVDDWRGLRFNSPNDVVVSRDGAVWFTDPSYGALQGFKDAPMLGDYVYRFDPRTQQISVVADDFNKPNGLAFSPDESVLYINDSAAIQGPGSYYPALPHHLRAFDVVDGRHLRNGRLFAVVSPGIPDGLKVDDAGRVYSSSASGLQVFNPEGDLIGEILAPGVANFCFGGPGRNVIFMMADPSIFQVRIAATG